MFIKQSDFELIFMFLSYTGFCMIFRISTSDLIKRNNLGHDDAEGAVPLLAGCCSGHTQPFIGGNHH